MAAYLTKAMETRVTEVDKYALKLLGISKSELTDEKILESLSKYILPSSIKALLFDSFNNFYVLFLTDIDSVYRLVGITLKCEAHCIKIYPLFDCFWIDNVYPCISNNVLRDIFKTFGNVFKVSYRRIVPNSSKFSHIISGQREITFLLPGKESAVCIPLNFVHPPYSFHVRRFCCACLKEDHSVLHCPALENDPNSQTIKCKGSENDSNSQIIKCKGSENDSNSQIIKCEGSENDPDSQIIKCEGSENDSELEALIKSEEFHSFEDNKLEDEPVDSNSKLDSVKSEEFHPNENYEVEEPVSDELKDLTKSEEFQPFENSKLKDPASEPQSFLPSKKKKIASPKRLIGKSANHHSHRRSRKAGKS